MTVVAPTDSDAGPKEVLAVSVPTTCRDRPARHRLGLDLSDAAMRRFGHYELVEPIGEGSSGTVFRARQTALGREVAIKLLSAGPWASADAVEVFEREARNAAMLDHPNIITMFDIGCLEDIHYYSMRLIRGVNLAVLLRQVARLPERRAARLIRALAGAVACVHRGGMLHLDIHPANVLVDQAGAPCLTDFSLARHLEGAPTLDNDAVAGTPCYMAPEQALLHAYPLSRATDVWALGAVLYQLVTGHAPFRGGSMRDTLELVLSCSVRAPHFLVPDLSRKLERIILKCLYKDSALRYQSADALVCDLDRFLSSGTMAKYVGRGLWQGVRRSLRRARGGLASADDDRRGTR